MGKVDSFAPAAGAAAISSRGVIHFEILPKNMDNVTKVQIPMLGDTVAGANPPMPLNRTPSPNGTARFRDAWPSRIKERNSKTRSPPRF